MCPYKKLDCHGERELQIGTRSRDCRPERPTKTQRPAHKLQGLRANPCGAYRQNEEFQPIVIEEMRSPRSPMSFSLFVELVLTPSHVVDHNRLHRPSSLNGDAFVVMRDYKHKLKLQATKATELHVATRNAARKMPATVVIKRHLQIGGNCSGQHRRTPASCFLAIPAVASTSRPLWKRTTRISACITG
jgi:hypothetical protein